MIKVEEQQLKERFNFIIDSYKYNLNNDNHRNSIFDFFMKFHNSKIPNLDLKCNENFEFIIEPDEYEGWYESSQRDWNEDIQKRCRQYLDAKTYRDYLNDLSIAKQDVDIERGRITLLIKGIEQRDTEIIQLKKQLEVFSSQSIKIGEIGELKEKVEKLQAFKDYVHQRLDDAGVEKEPNGEHSEHGCRIGDRLDLVLN